ncbi:sigma-54-dependent transcriptional regulator [Beijerinckia indica]|uniref:Two component, sigma54 specific, transcriptional regulator, Fis family n=1 Tax=Beijerinckia indica subsp. indica (strain ATCC 9039 / DSM 1715 / NCIMB 8712) TaxID=395963 RepID=B2IJ40_BEII9|nr:sigma-54 dependent transcriptional regulator [Beijerinckia indica]ACB94803.1 two component, sigma54 specific, transcriptional regulator, Fis family [Beijerinckia indica subsp. indica ATCC 9039]
MNDLPPILVVDDEPRSVEVMARVLREEFDVHVANGAEAALAVLNAHWIQAIFCDQRMPGMTGVKLLADVRQRWPDIVRIIVTGYTDPDDMIEAINEAGIYQYITKPWHPDQLLLAARNATQLFAMQREHDRLSLELRLARPAVEKRLVRERALVRETYHFEALVRTQGSPLNETCHQAAKAATFDIPVLIQGETGTGKELLARAIHYASQRASGPFLAVNCGAIPDTLLESELFGHKKGSFTGAHANRRGLLEEADGGTLLLDEIGDISPAFQVKLLRFLQEGEIRAVGANESRRADVRILSATHRDLREEVRAGRFREDLYFRLAAMALTMPPLRKRPGDVRVLADHLLDTLSARHGRRVHGFTAEAMTCLMDYDWPGNVRELQNEVLRMLVLTEGDLLGADLLSPGVLHRVAGARASGHADGEAMESPTLSTPESGPLQERIERIEAQILMETIVRCRWNKSRAAKELGLSRVGLRAKLERYGIAPDAGRETIQ